MSLRRARQRALALRAAHGLTGAVGDAALDALLRSEGLAVVERCPFAGRAQEVYAAGLLGIGGGLPRPRVRWLKAHGLGHHLLHRGNHAYTAHALHFWARQELEAELFAGTLLLPEGLAPGCGLGDLAAAAGVPPACLASWQIAAIAAHEERAARF